MTALVENEWFIQAPWGRISIVAWGNCLNPPVLMCHGQVDSAASFKPLIQLLPRNFYYICMEIPGNGKSDPFPRGLVINAFDVTYAFAVVVKHFRFEQFVFMGHSLGTVIGKMYNMCYPGKISKVIDLDPTTVYEAIDAEEFPVWYNFFYTKFYEKYNTFNGTKETAPTYTREKALAMLKRNRGLIGEVAENTLDRLTETLDNGLLRFIYDQRTKIVTRPPYSTNYSRKLFTNIQTPTLAVVTDSSVKNGLYAKAPHALDETAYPGKNYRVKMVKGNHDIHCIHPERVAPFVSQFLLYGLEGIDAQAKL